MAHVLRFSFLPGPITVTLTSGDYALLHWTPNVPKKRIVERKAPMSGGIIDEVYEEHVKEKIIVE